MNGPTIYAGFGNDGKLVVHEKSVGAATLARMDGFFRVETESSEHRDNFLKVPRQVLEQVLYSIFGFDDCRKLPVRLNAQSHSADSAKSGIFRVFSSIDRSV